MILCGWDGHVTDWKQWCSGEEVLAEEWAGIAGQSWASPSPYRAPPWWPHTETVGLSVCLWSAGDRGSRQQQQIQQTITKLQINKFLCTPSHNLGSHFCSFSLFTKVISEIWDDGYITTRNSDRKTKSSEPITDWKHTNTLSKWNWKWAHLKCHYFSSLHRKTVCTSDARIEKKFFFKFFCFKYYLWIPDTCAVKKDVSSTVCVFVCPLISLLWQRNTQQKQKGRKHSIINTVKISKPE